MGTWAPDCSKPPSEDNQYVTYRIDGEKVRREVASGDANAADVRAVDQADGTEPGEIFVHLADPKFDMTFLFKVEPNRHRIWTMSLNNQMLIISGRRASDKVELPWINRCGG